METSYSQWQIKELLGMGERWAANRQIRDRETEDSLVCSSLVGCCCVKSRL